MTREEAILWLQVLKHSKINWVGEQAEDEDVIARCEEAEQEAFDIAIEALQREIPKNPIVNYVADSDGARRLNDGWTEDSYLCPVCHAYFGEVYDEGYCYKCGQKLIQKRVRVIKE